MGIFPKDRNLARAPERLELPVRCSDFRERADRFHIRLDAFLCHHLAWRSRTSVQALIQDGFVRVGHNHPDGSDPEPAVDRRRSRILRDGAVVVIEIPPELRLPSTTSDGDELVVLHEDEDLLAVDKPPFLPVHPSGRHVADTLIQRVHARYARLAATPAVAPGAPAIPERVPVRLCHRLDRETSGIVLMAKSTRAHRRMMKQFEGRSVIKEYLAIVHGRPAQDAGRIELPLGPARTSRVRLKIAARADGLPSCTEWRVVERRGAFTLLLCRLLTGRQHQIRVHLDAIGHPLVGDKLYGIEEDVFLRAAAGALTPEDEARLLLPRHALHHHRLVVQRPLSGGRGEPLELVSPLAPDLREFLGRP